VSLAWNDFKAIRNSLIDFYQVNEAALWSMRFSSECKLWAFERTMLGEFKPIELPFYPCTNRPAACKAVCDARKDSLFST
jgi:hypothetical protein